MKGSADHDRFGESVKLADYIFNGYMMLAAGADDYIRIYKSAGIDWILDKEFATGGSSKLFDLSPNGNTFAISNASGVNIYRNDEQEWNLVGSAINRNNSAVSSIDLSSDGQRIVVGENSSEGSVATIYELDGDNWVAIGNHLISEGSRNDISVSISHDGSKNCSR